MKKRELIPLTSYEQVPKGMTEEQAREFWDTHAFTEEYLASMPPVPEDEFPPVGQLREFGPIQLDLEDFRKARWLARRRDMSLEDLIGELVTEAVAAEIRRIRATPALRHATSEV
jgi:hypothetical protein